jgi:phospholipid/cholesterol/gamma-HCH transport system substrate-binding protein
MTTIASQKIKTGIFTALGLGILVLFIFLIGGRRNLFSSTFNVKGYFKNVSGLMSGNNVRFAGINVGTVNDITIVNDTTVLVDMVLQEKVKPFIKTDSKLSIGSDGLMGDKLLTISAGTDSLGKAVAHNQVLPVINPMDMDKIMVRVNGIATDAEMLMNNLAGISAKINDGKGSLGRLLNDDKLARNLESTIVSTKQTVQSIDKAASGLGDNMEAAKKSILFRGYFKGKEKQRIKDSIAKAKKLQELKLKKKQ